MKRTFSIIDKAVLWLGIAIVIAAGALRMFFNNMRYSIQFTGGMEVVVNKETIDPSIDAALTTALQSRGYQDFTVGIGGKDQYSSVLLQMDVANDEQVSEVTELVQDVLLNNQVISTKDDILELSIIWPSIGDYIRRTAKSALIWGVILMAVYILFAFAGMRELVSPVLLGGITILTMLFDVSFAAGAYGFLMSINPAIQIDTIFIIALLTVLWYSVNDTIVILDRVRENFVDKHAMVEKGSLSRAEIFEMSLWQTMRRSIATSLSTLLVVGAMYLFGTGVLRLFAFTLGMGVIAGTYSSIFLAAPFAYLLSSKHVKGKKK